MTTPTLHARVDEVLYYLWDPIGVSGVPSCRDEYSAYVAGVISMLKGRCSADDIATHLRSIEQDKMGLPSNPERATQRTLRAAHTLVTWGQFLLPHSDGERF